MNTRTILALIILLVGLILTACGDEPTPVSVQLPPTWTPTPYQTPTAAPPPSAAEPTATLTPIPVEIVEPPPEVEVAPATEPPPPPPTDTPVPEARLIVTAGQAALRSGPGPRFDQAGTASQDDVLTVLGKNVRGTWWQVDIDGQELWIKSDQVRAENADGILVAQNIPQPPPRPTQPPPPPTNTPVPPPASHPDLGPCGGDDGCKFKVRGGPSTAANGGLELKMQLGFVHGGRGNEAQGDYRVVLKKDGAKIPGPENTLSVRKSTNQGSLGIYNYEFSTGSSSLPGGSVAGNYTIWVLDGNRERDSEPVSFSVPEGQGLLWILFDQG